MSTVHWPRRALLKSAAGLWVAAQASRAWAAQAGGTLPRVRMALAASQSLYHLPLTLADRLGFFEQAGVAVEWLPKESGAQALRSALQGQADVVAGAYQHLFGLHQRGLNYQSFVQISRTPQVSLGGSTRHGLTWRQFGDIRGARVGVSALNSTTHWTACQFLLRQGLKPEDVTFVEVGSSVAVVESLHSGHIDALCNPDPVMHWLEQKQQVLMLGDARTLQGTRQWMGGAVPGASLFAHADFLQRHPERVQAMSNAVVRALKWLHTAGLTDILKIVPASHWTGDRAVYLGAFQGLRESYAVDGLVRREQVSRAWRLHAKLKGRSMGQSIATDRTFTNAFVQKAPSARGRT